MPASLVDSQASEGYEMRYREIGEASGDGTQG